MKLYQPRVHPGHEWVIPVRDTDHEVLLGLGGTSRLVGWQPVVVSLLTADEDGAPCAWADLPWLSDHVLVLRPRAGAVLGPLLGPWGELLPLACPDADLSVFHALTVLDALDEDRSEIVRFDDGGILAVESYAFHAGAVTAPAFTVPQLPRGPLFVSEEVASAAADLTGTEFDEIWSG
ncbi:hypothetical protein ACTG9Q_13990 [Actinokineospora sp. 24-640]